MTDPADPFASPAAELGAPARDPRFAALEERLLGPVEIAGLSIRIYLSRFRQIAVVVLLIGLPINLLLTWLTPEELDSVGSAMSMVRIAGWIDNLIGVLLIIGIAKLTDDAVGERPSDLVATFRLMFTRWLPGVGSRILGGLGLFLLLLLLVVPGVIFFFYWMFIDQAVALRQVAGADALRYSKDLVTGRWWRVAGTAIAAILMLCPALIITVFAGVIIVDQVGSSLPLELATDALSDLALALFTVAATVLFLNLDNVDAEDHERFRP